ncbi:MAG TPA: DUF3108 domain-containing protein, partial [Noviherbaspirillum sp.]
MSEKYSLFQRWRGPLLRMLAVLALSLLLHALALHWAGGHIGLPSLAGDDAPPVAVALLPPPAPVAAAPEPPPPPTPKPRPKAKPKAVAPQQAPQQASAPATVTPPAETVAGPALADAAPPEPAPAPAQADSAPATPSAEPPPAAAATPERESFPRYQVRPPPSVDLKYEVRALRQGKEVYGNGRIVWHADGQRYRIDGEAGVLFFTVLRFQSQGGFDDFGVAPQSYVEKRMRKDETVTRF